MSFLEDYTAALEAKLPGLAEDLVQIGTEELEADATGGLKCFRDRGGPGLLVPELHGGGEATAVQALHCVRALAGLAPSLSVATTMHNFSVASLVSLEENLDGFEWMLLDAIANDRLLMSSAFAEGLTGQGILAPLVRADRSGEDWVLNGSKKPCSLSRSMDLLSASVSLNENDGSEPSMGVVVVPATAAGISVRPFWNAPVLRGAESDEVVLTDVEVADELVVRPDQGVGLSRSAVEARAFIWFTLLISGVYVGMAGALVDRLLTSGKGSATERIDVACTLEGATLGLERVAEIVDRQGATLDVLPKALVARRSAQTAVRETVPAAVELLGGMRFISDPMVGYLAAATKAFPFHPPSRTETVAELGKTFEPERPARV